MCEALLEQRWQDRLGCKGRGADEIKEHKYFEKVDWDIVSACKLPSPLKGVKGVPKRKKDKEQQAQRTAHNMLESDQKDTAQVWAPPLSPQMRFLFPLTRTLGIARLSLFSLPPPACSLDIAAFRLFIQRILLWRST